MLFLKCSVNVISYRRERQPLGKIWNISTAFPTAMICSDRPEHVRINVMIGKMYNLPPLPPEPTASFLEELLSNLRRDSPNVLSKVAMETLMRWRSDSFRSKMGTVLRKYELYFPLTLEVVREVRACDQNQTSEIACKYGRVDFLKYYANNYQHNICFDVVFTSAESGLIYDISRVYKLALSTSIQNIPIHDQADYKRTIEEGYVDCFHFLIEHCNVKVTETMCESAARNGLLFLLKFFVEHLQAQNETVGVRAWVAAILHSDLSCLKYLVHNVTHPVSDPSLAEIACRTRRIDALTVLHRSRYFIANSAIYAAVQGGSLVCLQYLHDQCGLDCWVPSTIAAGTRLGKVHLVKQLYAQGCPWDESALLAASATMHEKCFDFLWEHRGDLKISNPDFAWRLKDEIRKKQRDDLCLMWGSVVVVLLLACSLGYMFL